MTVRNVVEAHLSFPFSNRVIDRSLSAMNGCKEKGGKNPELQVTDHGSDTACMQTGRGRKKIALPWKKKKRKKIHLTFLKSTTNKREQIRLSDGELQNYEAES